MTPRWTIFPVLTLIAASCSAPTQPTASAVNPTPPQVAKAPEPKSGFKKPVRMNDRGELSSISLEQFFVLQQSGKALIFDARPAFFYQLGHIPGAVNLPKNGCDKAIADRESEIKKALADGKTIVTYCTSTACPDARTLAIHISGFGYPAAVFPGGWDAWKDAGMPAE